MYTRRFFVIIELDNVLYDFANYYLNIVKFINKFLSNNFDLDGEKFLDLFISKTSSSLFINNDYLYTSYEALKCLSNKALTFETPGARSSFINTLRIKFNQTRAKYLKLFPDAMNFLKTVKEMGGYIIGFTNSPSRAIKQRAKILDIDKFLENIYCLKDNFSEEKVDNNSNTPAGLWFHAICNNTSSLMCDTTEFLPIHQKPSKRSLQRILEEEKIQENNVIVIGNSIEKDILPARLMGLKAILVDTRIKLSDKTILSKFMKKMPPKQVRKLLNLPNNKPLLSKIDSLIRVSSIAELNHLFEASKIVV